MGKYFIKLAMIALALIFIGGITEYFSPSIKVDEYEILGPQNSIEASGLAPIVSAKGAILIKVDDGSVIYEKDADKKLYPASTTKIMTTLVALEILEEIQGDLQSTTTIPKEAVGIEGSTINLKEGEELKVEELLYGAMLQSGNDAATALALCCSGDLDAFVERMNAKAKELGCKSTNFVNPSGLFDENHYTTARDMARIGRVAMKNEIFRKIAGTKEWKSDTSGSVFKNKNKAIHQYEGATGVKIGYTKKSGRTLVASARKDDVELIAVVLNDPNWFEDAYAMLDYGFEREKEYMKGVD